MDANQTRPLLTIIENGSLAGRLWTELIFAVEQLVDSPTAYLKAALLPDSLSRFSSQLAGELRDASSGFLAHPIVFIRDAIAPDTIGLKRQRLLRRVLAASATAHSVLIVYLVYVAVISPFMNIRVVDREYRQIDVTKLLEKLRYPPQLLRNPRGPAMSLEEIRERQRKRRAELERRRREEAEREAERKRQEEEAKKAEEARLAKAEAEKKPAKYGDVNVAPIRDLVGKIYEVYQAGQLDLDTENFSIMAKFKVEPDGSIPISSIGIVKSSGSKVLDKNAIEILWRLGESHALGPLHELSSNTIRLEVKDTVARLTITSFASSPEKAKSIAQGLNFFLGIFRATQKSKSPNVAELLGMLKVTSDNNRVDAEMSVSKSRASEMLRAQYGTPSSPNQ